MGAADLLRLFRGFQVDERSAVFSERVMGVGQEGGRKMIILKLLSKLGMLKMASILSNAGRSMSGFKTYGAGLIFLALGLIGVIVAMWPDLGGQISSDDYNNYIELIAAGLAIIGGAHKLEKGRAETIELSKNVKDLIEILGGNAGAVQKIATELSKAMEETK